MAKWNTAEEISERYVVGLERLVAYAERGNLARRRLEDGTLLFDEESIANLFRPRRGAATAPQGSAFMTTGAPPSLGVLGVTRLGDPPARADSALVESRRHRPLRSDVVPTFAVDERAPSGRRAAG